MDSHLNAAIVIAAGGVKALQQLKGMHGVTRNTPPPASPPSGRRRGSEKECAEIRETRQEALDEYFPGVRRPSEFGKQVET